MPDNNTQPETYPRDPRLTSPFFLYRHNPCHPSPPAIPTPTQPTEGGPASTLLLKTEPSDSSSQEPTPRLFQAAVKGITKDTPKFKRPRRADTPRPAAKRPKTTESCRPASLWAPGTFDDDYDTPYSPVTPPAAQVSADTPGLPTILTLPAAAPAAPPSLINAVAPTTGGHYAVWLDTAAIETNLELVLSTLRAAKASAAFYPAAVYPTAVPVK